MGFRNPITRLSELAADFITGAVIRTRADGKRVQIGAVGGDPSLIQFFPAIQEDGFPTEGTIRAEWKDAATDDVGVGYAHLRIDGPQQVFDGRRANIVVGEAVRDFGNEGTQLVSLDAPLITMTCDEMLVNGTPVLKTAAGGALLVFNSVQTATVTITFPTPFAVPPIVVVTPTDERFTAAIVGLSAFNVTIRARYILGNTGAGFTLGLYWHASEPS